LIIVTKAVVPQQKDAAFAWDIPSQKWVFNASASPVTIAVTSVTLDKATLIVSDPANGGER